MAEEATDCRLADIYRVIVEHEAAIVGRIFDECVAARRPREIAIALNAQAVPPPRGRDWTASTLNGNTKRAAGTLTTELYANGNSPSCRSCGSSNPKSSTERQSSNTRATTNARSMHAGKGVCCRRCSNAVGATAGWQSRTRAIAAVDTYGLNSAVLWQTWESVRTLSRRRFQEDLEIRCRAISLC